LLDRPEPALEDKCSLVHAPKNAWRDDASRPSVAPRKGFGNVVHSGPLDVDAIIDKLLGSPASKSGLLAKIPGFRGKRASNFIDLEEGQLRQLIGAAREAFLKQPTLLELDAPVKIMGDIHGQYSDLLNTLESTGHPPDANYVMLGDYVDRGQQSIETMSLLLAYKVKYPENIFLLRGNHECASITRIYGFYDECKRRYNVKMWKCFCDMFNCLPPAALIDDTILCMHGGISPELRSFDQIRNVMRPCDVPDEGLLCDLLWADPDKDASGWHENDRGVSYTFGPDVVGSFNEKLGLDLIVRAHQVVEDGYEFFAGKRLVTLFSAPNYCGEFDNSAAVLSIGADLFCTFQVFNSRQKATKQTGSIEATSTSSHD